jgi:asparagine synthase (glutamine-hydrolysing)
MDTSSIAAVAARHVRPLHTFNCGFDTTGVTEPERTFDESDAALAMSKALGTQHHTLLVGPGDMERCLASVVWHLDEPRVGISYQVHRTSALVRQWVTVVLSGVGGDELFGGYPWRYRPILQLRDPSRFEEEYFRLWHRMVPAGELERFFTPGGLSALGGFSPRDSFREVLDGAPVDWDPLHRAMYFDAKTFLNGLLVVDDKLNMSHSVEGRVPFLDCEMIELAARMPARLKLDAERTKIVLREAMRGLIPERILARAKVGFTPPDATWYRTTAAPTIEGLILGRRCLARGLFEPAYLRRVWREHLSRAANHRFLLWSLMCFEIWCRLFLDGEPPVGAEPRLSAREPMTP